MNINELLEDADFVGKLAALASSLPPKEVLPKPSEKPAPGDFNLGTLAGGIVSDDCTG